MIKISLILQRDYVIILTPIPLLPSIIILFYSSLGLDQEKLACPTDPTRTALIQTVFTIYIFLLCTFYFKLYTATSLLFSSFVWRERGLRLPYLHACRLSMLVSCGSQSSMGVKLTKEEKDNLNEYIQKRILQVIMTLIIRYVLKKTGIDVHSAYQLLHAYFVDIYVFVEYISYESVIIRKDSLHFNFYLFFFFETSDIYQTSNRLFLKCN